MSGTLALPSLVFLLSILVPVTHPLRFEDDEDEPRPQSTLAADAFSGKLDKLGVRGPMLHIS